MAHSNLIKVKLTKPHTHQGVKHAAGDTIAVPAPDAAWLESNGIGGPSKLAESKTARSAA
jgi:hypothetical protein